MIIEYLFAGDKFGQIVGEEDESEINIVEKPYERPSGRDLSRHCPFLEEGGTSMLARQKSVQRSSSGRRDAAATPPRRRRDAAAPPR